MGLFTRNKSNKKPIIKQILELIPGSILQSSIAKHQSDKFCSKYKTYDHLVSQMFGQLNKCQTLTDISTPIAVNTTFISDLGLKQSPARSSRTGADMQKSPRGVRVSVPIKMIAIYRIDLFRKQSYKAGLLPSPEEWKYGSAIDCYGGLIIGILSETFLTGARATHSSWTHEEILASDQCIYFR